MTLRRKTPLSRKKRLTQSRIRTLGRGEELPESSPRRYVDSRGYVRLRWLVAPNEYVEEYEHRIVMGRPDGEVHHKNGIKDDNRPDNLEVLSKAEHARLHADETRGQGAYAPYRSRFAKERAERSKQRRAEKQQRAAEMAKAYRSGLTVTEVGRLFGVDNSTVSRTLREAGVSTRTSGSPQSLSNGKRLVKARAGLRCERCGTSVKYAPSNVHHRKPRGMGGSSNPQIHSPTNLVLLCVPCHNHVEANRAEAYEHGWLVSRASDQDPGTVPVHVAGLGLCLPTDDGRWEKAA